MNTDTENQEIETPASEETAPAPKAKRVRKPKGDKKAKKTPKKAPKKAKKDKDALNLKKVNVDELRTRLKDGGHVFGSRMGAAKLVDMAKTAGIEIPMVEKGASGSNVIPEKYREQYGANQSCGDEVAKFLSDYTLVETKDEKGRKTKACSEEKLGKVAEANGITLDRWSHLNLGMKRMNLGNVLRGMSNQGKRVQIGAKIWKAKKEGDAEAL